MKHIAIFVSTFGSGGAEKQAALLAQVLSEYYKVHFVALYGDAEASKLVMSILSKAKVNVYPLAGPLKEKLKEYARILRENHVFCAFNYLTKCDFWGAIIEKRSGVKQIYNGIRNSKLDSYKTVLEWVSHNCIASSTIFNCYSGEKAFQKKGFKKSKCIIIPNCFPNIAEPISRLPADLPHIITVGRFVPQKDYETAIKAVALLKKMCNKFVFDICGYGDLEEQIREWVKKYDVEDVVKFHIRSNSIPELLQKADIYLSTSLFEGTSNSIMEAMNWCLPVVATNVGDNGFLINDGENGFLHAIGDADGLAESLGVLMADSTKRNQMGIQGNIMLKDHYSVDIFEKRYRDLIER
jgi:glycosyltransferase involved in cell wall biosynthesis